MVNIDLTSLKFNLPHSVVKDSTHYYVLCIGDISNGVSSPHVVKKINLSGSEQVDLFSFETGWPHSGYMAINNGYLYVTVDNNSISKYSISTGLRDDNFGDNGKLSVSDGIDTLVIHNNNLYAASAGSSSVNKIEIGNNNQITPIYNGARSGLITLANDILYIAGDESQLFDTYNLSTNIKTELGSSLADKLTNDYRRNMITDGNVIYIAQGSNILYLKASDVADNDVIQLTGTITMLFIDTTHIYYTNGDVDSNNKSIIYKRPLIVFTPPLTPLYLGNAKINSTGDVEFQNSILTTLRYPEDQHELVPRAYVDKYIQNVVSFYNGILDISGNGVNLGLIERITNLEDQLERVYQAWWQKPRDEPTIVIGNGTGSPIVLAFEPAVDTNIGDESGLLQSNGVIHVPVAPANASSIGF